MISFRGMDAIEVSRRCRFYSNYFLEKKRVMLILPNNKDLKGCERSINALISECKFTEFDISLMEIERGNVMIPLDEFNWVKTSERACYWLWGCLRFSLHNLTDVVKDQVSEDSIKMSLYDFFKLNCTPSSTSERFELILDFFDRLRPSGLHSKIDYLHGAKTKWQKIYLSSDIFKWLDRDNDAQCDWVWKYIAKTQHDDGEENSQDDLSKSPSQYLKPLTNDEKYLAIYASYDLWNAHEDTKKLFLKNINKAWSQKKLRDNREGKKSLNTYLRSEVKDQLDELSRCYEKSKQAVLEMLIENEYKNKRKID